MASLQAYTSHGIRYYRIVESFRNNGKPSIRVLAHLGRVDDILHRHQHHPDEVPVRISSVSAGAVTALHHLTQELDLAGRINRAISPNGDVQVRDALTVGESLVAAMIARSCAPRSKRAFADWAKATYLPDLMHFTSSALTSQHFRDQMNAVPVEKLADIEQELVQEVVRIEQLHLQALAYDTTNFYTHIASTNLRPKLPQRGKNKQGRHDLRQMGLAQIVPPLLVLSALGQFRAQVGAGNVRIKVGRIVRQRLQVELFDADHFLHQFLLDVGQLLHRHGVHLIPEMLAGQSGGCEVHQIGQMSRPGPIGKGALAARSAATRDHGGHQGLAYG